MKDNKYFGRYLFCFALVAVILGTFVIRLIQWQLVQGDEFLAQAENSSSSFVVRQAARGEIFDVNGIALTSNKTVYNIVFNSLEMPRATRNETIAALIDLVEECNDQWTNELPITLDASGNYTFIENREDDIAYMKSSSMLRMNAYATAEDCVRVMCSEDFYNIDDSYSKEKKLNIAAVRYNMQKLAFSVSYPYTFAEDISMETVTVISETLSSLPGVSIEVSTLRDYSNGSLAPHILGATGALSAEEYESLKEQDLLYSASNLGGYTYNDKIGKSGIELVLEQELRGTSGKIVLQTDAEGAVTKNLEASIAPIDGNCVYLTLDANLQAVINASLAKNVQAARAAGAEKQKQAIASGEEKQSGYGEDCVSGAAVVLKVDDFSVLGMGTYPSYDLEKSLTDADYYASLLNDKTTPLVNRATMGTYTPGSVIKPAITLAALQEGVITAQTGITCDGTFHEFNDYHPTCMGVHGNISFFTAIERSCNIFYYDTGYHLGITKMNLYCELLGLGQKTGIEISERSGILANPQEYSDYHDGEIWTDGITVQAAIGQADNSFTPLQLATYVATIANNGIRLQPHLIDKITNYTRDEVLYQSTVTEVANIGVDQEHLDKVKQAMSLVTQENGTASRFSNYGIKIAAKTGTATTVEEIHADNVTFIAFAPYENPEIAVAVVLEYGGSGLYSMNVAEDIFNAYFYGMTPNEVAANESTPNESAPNEAAADESGNPVAPNET